MIQVPPNANVVVMHEPINFRNGIEGTAAIARTVLELDPAPRSVGVAIPGEVDPTGRCWGLPNVPGFKGVQLGKGLSDRLRCPVAVENDATTAALGEYLYGHGTRYPSFLMITLGTGIGGGLVIGGQLYPGSNGFAGEIGHINIDPSPEAPQCGCGKAGCMETDAGTAALLRKYAELGGQATEIREIADAARRGEAAGAQGALDAGSGQFRCALGGALGLDSCGAVAVRRDVPGARRLGKPESAVLRRAGSRGT